jgi:hypothetical protein
VSFARRPPLGTALLHPVALAAIAALVLNDHVLKAHYPGLVTGKLSDFAGIVLAPLTTVATLDALAPMSLLRRYSYPATSAWACTALVACVFAITKTWMPATHAYQETVALARAPLEWIVAYASSERAENARVVLVRDPTDLIALPTGIIAALVARRRGCLLTAEASG